MNLNLLNKKLDEKGYKPLVLTVGKKNNVFEVVLNWTEVNQNIYTVYRLEENEAIKDILQLGQLYFEYLEII
ncbi:MAG: hypothetical protein ACRC0V_10985 [Fusobacteriaceae bacterium]